MNTARVVEVFGAPGVGKSTLTQALVERVRTDRAIRMFATSDVLRQPRFVAKRKAGASSVRALLRRRAPWLVPLLYSKPSSVERWEALRFRAPAWRQFLEFCLQTDPADRRPPEERLLGLYWLMETLQRRALLERSQIGDAVVVVDESLAARYSLFCRSPRNVERERRYFELMPLPAAAIHLTGQVDAVAQRLTHKSGSSARKTALRHVDVTERELREDIQWTTEVSALGAGILRERGASVLTLDAAADVQVNCAAACRFIDETFGVSGSSS